MPVFFQKHRHKKKSDAYIFSKMQPSVLKARAADAKVAGKADKLLKKIFNDARSVNREMSILAGILPKFVRMEEIDLNMNKPRTPGSGWGFKSRTG